MDPTDVRNQAASGRIGNRRRRLGGWVCVAVGVWAAAFLMIATGFEWFVGDWWIWLAGPMAIAAWVPPVMLVPLLFACIGLRLAGPSRAQTSSMAVCALVALLAAFLPFHVHETAAHLYFAMHRSDLDRAVATARAGSRPAGDWLGPPEVTSSYVAFTMDGVLDNLSGLVHVEGEPPQMRTEFAGALLIYLEPLGDGWFHFATT